MPATPRARKLVLAGLAVAVATGLAACAPTDSPTGAPETGGTLNMQFTGVPISLDPALGGAGGSAVFTSLPYEPLIYQTADGTLIPDLATDWLFNDDNTVLTLTLRDGVEFVDGSTFDSAAVKGSLEYFQGAGGGNARYAGPIASIDTPDAQTVVITYSAPYPDGPYYMTQFWGPGEIISPEGVADPEALLTESHGAGQYIYSAADSVAGSEYVYTRNDNYWNPDAQQWDAIHVKVIGDPSAVLSAIQTDQISFSSGAATTADAASSSGLDIVTGAFFNWGLTLADSEGTMVPALKDQRVRQAIAMAIDRDALANAISPDFAHANGQLGNKGIDGYVDGADWTYDPEAAKSLLAEAGYPDGFELTVLTENILDNQTTISQAIASDLGKIGITVNLEVKNSVPDFIQAALTAQYPALIWPVVGTNTAQVAANFVNPGLTNPFGNDLTELKAVYGQAQSAGTDAREGLYKDITTTSKDLAFFVPVMSTDNIYYVASNLGNVAASALNPNPFPQAPDAQYAWTHN